MKMDEFLNKQEQQFVRDIDNLSIDFYKLRNIRHEVDRRIIEDCLQAIQNTVVSAILRNSIGQEIAKEIDEDLRQYDDEGIK